MTLSFCVAVNDSCDQRENKFNFACIAPVSVAGVIDAVQEYDQPVKKKR